MIDIFKEKTVYKFSTRDPLERWDPSKVELWGPDVILFLAKHAKKQVRCARKDEWGTTYYHYYLDEKHMMYIDLAWPHLSRAIRGLQDD